MMGNDRPQDPHTSQSHSPEKIPFENYCVLILEESKVRAELFEKWLSDVTTRIALSIDELDSRLDSRVAVVCICRSLIEDNEAEVRKRILTSNPYCQLILMLPRSTIFSSPFEDRYDACLNRPLFEEELQSTVEKRLLYSVYTALLTEFYYLNGTLIMEPETGRQREPDLSHSKASKRLRDIRSQLQSLRSVIDGEEIYEIVQSLDLHGRYLQEPAQSETATKQSKFHPPRCPQCKLEWGVDHGNELGAGFDRVAAHVWKCTSCENLVHGLGAGSRRLY